MNFRVVDVVVLGTWRPLGLDIDETERDDWYSVSSDINIGDLGDAGHREEEHACSGMELDAVNARGARAGGSSRQQRCSSSSVEAEVKWGMAGRLGVE